MRTASQSREPPRLLVGITALFLVVMISVAAAAKSPHFNAAVFALSCGFGGAVTFIFAVWLRALWNGVLTQVGPFMRITVWHSLGLMELVAFVVFFFHWSLNVSGAFG